MDQPPCNEEERTDTNIEDDPQVFLIGDEEYQSLQGQNEETTTGNAVDNQEGEDNIDDVSSDSSSQNYTFDEEEQEAQRKAVTEFDYSSSPMKINENQDEVQLTSSNIGGSPLASKDHDFSPSKFTIPPPLNLPSRPRGAPMDQGYEEDTEKTKFIRFLKMVERKNEAAANRLAAQTSQTTLQAKTFDKSHADKEQDTVAGIQDDEGEVKRYDKAFEGEDDEERDIIHLEGLYELHRKRKVNQRLVRGYCQMLDVDYNHNRIVVCGYQAHILKTVSNMIQKKPTNKKQGLGTNRRSMEKMQIINSKASPVKVCIQQQSTVTSAAASTLLVNQNGQVIPYDPHLMISQLILNSQNPRMFFMFDKDNAEKMFGFRVKYLGPEEDENEDICYAYRHIPQPKSPKIVTAVMAIMDTSPRLMAVSPKAAPNAITHLHHSTLTTFKTPISRKAPQIKQIYLNEVANATKKYLQIQKYATQRLIRFHSPSEDEQDRGDKSPNATTGESVSPSKKPAQKMRKLYLHWTFVEPIAAEESVSPTKTLRKQQSNYRGLYDNPFRQSQNLHLLKTHKNSQSNLQKMDGDRTKHASSVNGGQSPPISMMGGANPDGPGGANVGPPPQFSGFSQFLNLWNNNNTQYQQSPDGEENYQSYHANTMIPTNLRLQQNGYQINTGSHANSIYYPPQQQIASSFAMQTNNALGGVSQAVSSFQQYSTHEGGRHMNYLPKIIGNGGVQNNSKLDGYDGLQPTYPAIPASNIFEDLSNEDTFKVINHNQYMLMNQQRNSSSSSGQPVIFMVNNQGGGQSLVQQQHQQSMPMAVGINKNLERRDGGSSSIDTTHNSKKLYFSHHQATRPQGVASLESQNNVYLRKYEQQQSAEKQSRVNFTQSKSVKRIGFNQPVTLRSQPMQPRINQEQPQQQKEFHTEGVTNRLNNQGSFFQMNEDGYHTNTIAAVSGGDSMQPRQRQGGAHSTQGSNKISKLASNEFFAGKALKKYGFEERSSISSINKQAPPAQQYYRYGMPNQYPQLGIPASSAPLPQSNAIQQQQQQHSIPTQQQTQIGGAEISVGRGQSLMMQIQLQNTHSQRNAQTKQQTSLGNYNIIHQSLERGEINQLPPSVGSYLNDTLTFKNNQQQQVLSGNIGVSPAQLMIGMNQQQHFQMQQQATAVLVYEHLQQQQMRRGPTSIGNNGGGSSGKAGQVFQVKSQSVSNTGQQQQTVVPAIQNGVFVSPGHESIPIIGQKVHQHIQQTGNNNNRSTLFGTRTAMQGLLVSGSNIQQS